MSTVFFPFKGLRFNCPLVLGCSLALFAGLAPAADKTTTPAIALQTGSSGGTDFTRICWNGDAEGQSRCVGTLVSNSGLAPQLNASSDWACTRDNRRKLVWSLRSVPAKAEEVFAPDFNAAGHDAAVRCGFNSGWRLPTRSELASIVVPGRLPGPMQQSPYFVGTGEEFYWSSDVFSTDPGYAWGILYGYNGSIGYYRTLPTHVRLVHDAQ